MYVYLAKFSGRAAVKIGKTSRLKVRFRELAQVHGSLEWAETCQAGAQGARHLEEFLHQRFKDFGVQLPKCDGHTEFYDSCVVKRVKAILLVAGEEVAAAAKSTCGGLYRRKDGANFCWHVKVPADLKTLYGGRVWATQLSLHTPDRADAEIRAAELGKQWLEKFKEQRKLIQGDTNEL